MKRLAFGALLILFSAPTVAYIGPGLGLGVIGTIVGVLAAIVLAVIGLCWYPLKRAFRRKNDAAEDRQSRTAASAMEQTEEPMANLALRSENPDQFDTSESATAHAETVSAASDQPADGSAEKTVQ